MNKKQTIFIVLAAFALGVSQLKAQTTINTIISANETWKASGNPYILTANSSIQPGVTVTIEPGVVIKSTARSNGIYISGTLIAKGTKDSIITFDTATISFPKGAPGHNFTTGTGTIFDYCYFNLAGGNVSAISITNQNLYVKNSKFTNFYNGIYHSNAYTDTIKIKVKNTQFIGGKDAAGYAVYSISGYYTTLEMDQCLVKHSYGSYFPNNTTITRSTFYDIQTFSGLRINAYAASNQPKTKVTLSCNTFRKFKGDILYIYGFTPGNQLIVNNNTFDSAENHINLYMLYFDKPRKVFIYNNNFLNATNYAVKINAGSSPTANPDTLVMTQNYWGSSTKSVINQKIYDYADNIVVQVVVKYDSILTSMVTDCAAGDTSIPQQQQNAIVRLEKSNFNLMPNPANSVLNIATETMGKHQIYIRDLSGALVYQSNFTGISEQVQLDKLSSGMYFVTIQTEGKAPLSAKLVVQKQ